MPEIGEHGAARDRVCGHSGGRGQLRVGEDVVVKNDLGGDGGGVPGRRRRVGAAGRGVRGRSGRASRDGRIPGGQSKRVGTNDRIDGTEEERYDPRGRRPEPGDSRDACGVADRASATGVPDRATGV